MRLITFLKPASGTPSHAGPTCDMRGRETKVAVIVNLSVDFEQQKFAPLLKKPLVSCGTVFAKAAAVLWNTRTPEPTLMRGDE